MKNAMRVSLIAGLVIGSVAACGQSEEKTEAVTRQEAVEEVREAAEAVASLTQQEMDSFANQIDSQLQRFQGRIDELKSQAQTLQGDAKTAVEEKIAALEERQTQARQKFDELKTAGADAWEDVKLGLQAAMLRLNQALQDASSEFKNRS